MNELQAFEKRLRENEKSPATIEKYLRDARAFLCWLDGREPTKELTVCYKEGLTERYEAASVHSMLAGINSYLSFSGRADCRVKPLRVQRTLFGSEERELSREEYARLVRAAGGGGPAQGLSPFSAASVRPRFLQRGKGPSAACGHPRPRQREHHAHLHHGNRTAAHEAAGARQPNTAHIMAILLRNSCSNPILHLHHNRDPVSLASKT